MESEKLPSSFDVIIIGTGLPEAMVAASLSRVGKSVLHIDRNDYYGGNWATFNFDALLRWFEENNKVTSVADENSDKGGEHIVQIPLLDSTFRNVEIVSFIPETNPSPTPVNTNELLENKNKVVQVYAGCENKVDSNENKQPDEITVLPTDGMEDKNADSEVQPEQAKDIELKDNSNSDGKSEPEKNVDPENQSYFKSLGKSNIAIQAKIKQNASEASIEDLKSLSRKFNLDIAPKFLFSAGPLVNAILKANISHYSEFQIVNRILTCADEEIIEVPCNRSDIFSSSFLSMIEKRTLMKFLTLCLDFYSEKLSEDISEYLQKPFVEFLKSRRLSENLQKFIIYSIAMVKPETLTELALKETSSFLKSLGRYGKSPFIWPLYGVGELPQAFCRMSAVFGSLYCLSKPASSLQIEDDICTKVVLGDESVDCKYVVMSQGYLPTKYSKNVSCVASRAIVVTDASVFPSDIESISFLTIPPLKGKKELVRVIEVGPTASACPTGLFVLYLNCVSTAKATQDLEDYVKLLTTSKGDIESKKPKLLWSLYFNQIESERTTEKVPENLFVTQLPGNSLGFQDTVDNAEQIFQKICPDGEFLMAVPNSEDILWDTEPITEEKEEKEDIQNDSLTD